jgi:hypothetical protein
MAKGAEAHIRNSKEQENPRSLKMLHLQLKSFNLSGILPPASISGKRWKAVLYDIFTAVSLFWFLPTIALQMVALYESLDDIEVVTAVLFQVSCYISTGIIFFYFVWKRKELVKLFDTLEAGFISHMDKVGSPTRRKAILDEASRKSAVITWTLMGLCFTVQAAWGCIPCILGYVEYLTDTEPRDLTNDRGRYFGLTMWLPENVNQSPTYEFMHVFHMIAVYTVVSNITGCYMLMFAFAFHTTTQFKILCAAFEDVDDFVQTLHDSEYNTATGPRREWNSTKRTMDNLNPVHEGLPMADDNYAYIPGSADTDMVYEYNFHGYISGYLGQHESDITHQRDKAFDLRYSKDFSKLKGVKLDNLTNGFPEELSDSDRRSEIPNAMSSTSRPCDEFVQQYLTDCIQFHQALIE